MSVARRQDPREIDVGALRDRLRQAGAVLDPVAPAGALA
jgi:hypothetical protein